MVELSLLTFGFVARWQLERFDDRFVGNIAIDRLPAAAAGIRSVEFAMTPADARRLAQYLTAHLARLRSDARELPGPFVTYELGFQLDALAGDVDEQGDGNFTVRLLLNVGAGEHGFRVYAGAEAAMDVAALSDFVAQLEALAGS